MSHGTVFRKALQILGELQVDEPLISDIVNCLSACNTQFTQFIYELSAETNFPRDLRLGRAAAVLFEYAAVQLGDDLVDGDCHYLTEPARSGPTVLMALQNLFVLTLSRHDVPGPALSTVTTHLQQVAAAQQTEVFCTQWNLERSKQAALGLNGRQFAAYLTALWHGTPLEPIAQNLGTSTGIAIHVGSDILSNDQRFFSLTEPDRTSLARWADTQRQKAAQFHIPSVCRVLVPIERALEAYIS